MAERTTTITLKDGRELTILETGVLDGTPVLSLHGTPGSRLLSSRWIKDAEEKGIRLMGYDRAGYGGSSPDPGRNVAKATQDIAEIAEQLGIDKLLVWGISGGGPHALACAALLPDLVPAVGSLAAVAPYPADGLDWMAGMGEDNIVEFGAALDGREKLEAFIEGVTPGTLSANAKDLLKAFETLLTPVDAAEISEDYVKFLIERFKIGIGKRRDGWIDDDIAFTKDWGFSFEQIKTPVLLMQGAQDKFVPYAHGEWLSKHIPGVEARLLPDDGHITLVANRVPEVHQWLLDHLK